MPASGNRPIRSVTEHAANLRRLASELEAFDDRVREELEIEFAPQRSKTMASAYIMRVERKRDRGGVTRRYRVVYPDRGAETKLQHAGSFKTMAEARERQKWVSAELAARRLPDLRLARPQKAAETLAEAVARWRDSRIDVTESTRVLHRVALNRVTKVLGDRRVDEITRPTSSSS